MFCVCVFCRWAFVMKKHLSTHLLGKHGVGQRKERYDKHLRLHSKIDSTTFTFRKGKIRFRYISLSCVRTVKYFSLLSGD